MIKTMIEKMLFWGILFTVVALVMSGVSLYKLTRCDFKAPYKAEIIYAVGIIPPVGIVTGFMSIDDKEVQVK